MILIANMSSQKREEVDRQHDVVGDVTNCYGAHAASINAFYIHWGEFDDLSSIIALSGTTLWR